MFPFRARLGAALAVCTAALLLPGVAGAQPAEPVPTTPVAEDSDQPSVLDRTLTFDKPSYRTGDTVSVTLEVKNTGETDIVLHGYGEDGEPGDITLPHDAWDHLIAGRGGGVPVAAGATYTHTFTGRVTDPESAEAVFRGAVYPGNGPVEHFRVSAPVERVVGAAAGVVYQDRNGNRALDAGEAVATDVEIRGTTGSYTATTKSDAQGRFRFEGLAPGRHAVLATRVGEWTFRLVVVEVVAGETAETSVPGDLPFTDRVEADMRFAETTYQPGDAVELEIALTNVSPHPVVGVEAVCAREGPDGYELDGRAPGWGDLRESTGGVTLAVGETKRITVTDTVPETARPYGVLAVWCEFGSAYSPDNPGAEAYAKIPGAKGSAVVRAFHDRDGDRAFDQGEQVRGVELGLVHLGTGEVDASRRSGADGRAAFDAVPAGLFEVAVRGPWEVVPDQPRVGIKEGGCWWGCEKEVMVVPVKTQPTTSSPTPAPTTTPAPQGSAPPGDLPNTGADVRWLFGLGVLTVLTGAGLLLIRRKRA